MPLKDILANEIFKPAINVLVEDLERRVIKAVDHTYFLAKLLDIEKLGAEIKEFSILCIKNYGHLIDTKSIEELENEISFYIELAKLSKVENISDAVLISKDLKNVHTLIQLLEILPASKASGEKRF